jgi:hypothetical protein
LIENRFLGLKLPRDASAVTVDASFSIPAYSPSLVRVATIPNESSDAMATIIITPESGPKDTVLYRAKSNGCQALGN